jgi:hypothetical protein
MASFHKLCFCSSTALLVFKRAPRGLTMRGWDPEQGRDFAAQLREQVGNIDGACYDTGRTWTQRAVTDCVGPQRVRVSRLRVETLHWRGDPFGTLLSS